jgi:hypothetical protein
MAKAPPATTTAPRAEQAGTANQPKPPEERFWVHYSPHGEAPLSGAGSFAIHALIFGMILLVIFSIHTFGRSNTSIQVDPVRLQLGGGGGHREGQGDGPGIGELKEAARDPRGTTQASEGKLDQLPDPSSKLPLDVPKANPNLFDKESVRLIKERNSAAAKALGALSEGALAQLPRPGAGRGGSGRGGGRGEGVGTGTGNSTGAGQDNLSDREKRMLRWTMSFNTQSGANYIDQLKGLGAILAIPTQENPDNYQYKIIRDLRPGAPLLDEDLSRIDRIYWVDQKPESVQDVMRFLKVPLRPSHFVAFMPESLEQQLFLMEKRQLRLYPGKQEADIEETRFRVVPTRSGYRPELVDMRVR